MSAGIPNINPLGGSGGGQKPASSESTPSQLKGHAKYVEGAVEEAIGRMTDSQPWKDSGAQNKQSGVAEMRAAKEQSGIKESGIGSGQAAGRAERTLGKTVGCAGMEEIGAEKERRGSA